MEEIKYDRRLSDYRVNQIEKKLDSQEKLVSEHINNIVGIKSKLNILISIMGFIAVILSGNVFYFFNSIDILKNETTSKISMMKDKHNMDLFILYEKMNTNITNSKYTSLKFKKNVDDYALYERMNDLTYNKNAVYYSNISADNPLTIY